MGQPKSDVKSINTIHTAFLAGQIIFASVAYLITHNKSASIDEDTSRIFQTVAALFTISGVASAFFIFNKKVNAIKDDSPLNIGEKFTQYRAATIIKFALLEAPCLFSIIGYILTTNAVFMILAMILIVVFAAQKPTVILVMHHLQVTREDLMD
jgi:hypothetical protein